MNVRLIAYAAALTGVALLVNTGCEWSGGGGASGLNSSQGAGLNVNFTGVYDGNLGGGRAVAKTSKGAITRLVIQNSGNALEVTDNQGSRYQGTIGAPGVVTSPDATGTYPAGAEAVQSQINFAGKDEVAQKDIEFVGVIHLVTVTDVKGNTDNSSSTDTTTTGNTETKTTTFKDATNTTVVTEVTSGAPGDEFYRKETTTVTYDNATGKETSRTKTVEGSDTRTVTSSTTYSLTEANSQFRLEGTWIEKDGVVSKVDALSPGNAIIVSPTADTDTGSTPTTATTLF
jgi:hypothetical protein